MKNNYKLLIVSLLTIALAACSGDSSTDSKSGKNQETALDHAEKHANPKYVCPMHSNIIRDEPGSCPLCGMTLVKKKIKKTSSGKRVLKYYQHPHNATVRSKTPRKDEMGMDFVAVYGTEGEEDDSAVRISPSVVNNMGVRTAKATRGRLWRKIDTVAFVQFDEDKMSHVHMRAKGWVKNLKIRAKGDRVKKGQLIYEFYSPDLVNAQEEYVQALRSNNRSLIRASRDKMLALDISARQIASLTKTRRVSQLVQVYATQNGVVAVNHAREGMYVTPNMRVMTLADLSTVWLQAEVFESQSNWVAVGQAADVRISYLPGLVITGKVDYIYPSLNPKTRTLKVRLRFDNAGEKLKPNMYAMASIYGGTKKSVIRIPREALIRTGKSQRVIVALGKGRFAAREVVAGIESGEWVEITKGIMDDEVIVTSGQFLIDSEASLNASIARMSEPGAKDGAKMNKTDMNKSDPHKGHNMSSKNSMKQTDMTKADKKKINTISKVIANGVVRKVMMDDSKVNLNHDAIPALGWPAMKMDFKVKSGVKLDKLKPGDKIRFEMEKGKSGQVITNIKVVK